MNIIDCVMRALGDGYMDLHVARHVLARHNIDFRDDRQAERFQKIAVARSVERQNCLEQQNQEAHQADCDEGLL